MDFRKLISFGKNSYVISLPKTWIKQNKLKKGDILSVDQQFENLIVSPHSLEKETPEKSAVIIVDKKDLRQIKREVVTAYIRNNKTITLKGDDIKDHAKEFQEIIQGMVALEVMEQTTKTIVAKDFLNLESVSVTNIIRKMDIITRSMLSDCEQMFEEDTSESISHRDNDVNKLTFLNYKIIRYGFENTHYMMKHFNHTPLDLLSLWWVSYDIESIADEAKRIARYMQKIKLGKKQQEEYVKILVEIKKYYLKVMKAFYDKDFNLVHEVFNERSDLLEKCEKFYMENTGKQWVGFLLERTKAAIGHITHIGRALTHSFPDDN